MEIVEKLKRVLGRRTRRRCHPEGEDEGEGEGGGSGSYEMLSDHIQRHRQKKKKLNRQGLAPHGCLCVYVGPERERFVIKIELANHPSFKTLLEAAEKEYGFANDGPLWLPCDAGFFCEALVEMESGNYDMGSCQPPIAVL